MTAGGSDVTGLVVRLRPSALVSGRITFERDPAHPDVKPPAGTSGRPGPAGTSGRSGGSDSGRERPPAMTITRGFARSGSPPGGRPGTPRGGPQFIHSRSFLGGSITSDKTCYVNQSIWSLVIGTSDHREFRAIPALGPSSAWGLPDVTDDPMINDPMADDRWPDERAIFV